MRFFPIVERDIPIPPPPKPRRVRAKRIIPPSPWIKWLKERSPGDSFTTEFSEHLTVIKYLQQLGIPYQVRRIRPGRRFWILAQPYTYEPPYLGEGI